MEEKKTDHVSAVITTEDDTSSEGHWRSPLVEAAEAGETVDFGKDLGPVD